MNMFAKAWKVPAKTSTPVESHQIMGKAVPTVQPVSISETTVVHDIKFPGLPTVTPEFIQVTPVGTDIDVATTPVIKDEVDSVIGQIVKNSPNVIIATIDSSLNTPVVIAETRHIDIDTNEVVAESKIVAVPDYVDIIRDVNKTLQDLGNATTEDAYTYGINRLVKAKKDRPDDWIVGHIFGSSYDLWISEYDEANREFYGFASFGGILDYNAEWGYVSLDELLSIGGPAMAPGWRATMKLERDFYWTPTSLESLMDHHQWKEDDAREQALSLGADMDDDDIDPNEAVMDVIADQAADGIPVKGFEDFPEDWSAPFKPAEETASSTPDISWFDEPGYRKYDVVSRPTDRVNRLVGNMISEHKEMSSLYQNYSGKGGLHEVNYNECANFHEYTEAKQEFEMWEFYTPDSIAETMVKILRIPKSANVIDSTCGMSRFFNFIPNETRLNGLDVNWEAIEVSRKLFPDAFFNSRDVFRTQYYAHYNTIQYSIGNPPFNLRQRGYWNHPLASQSDQEDGGSGTLLSQNAYVYNNAHYLVEGGIAFFIVPATWLTWIKDNKAKKFIEDEYHMIAELALDNKAFSEYGVNFATKALLMVKKGTDISWDLPMYSGSFDKIKEFLVSPQYQAFLKVKSVADHSNAKIKLERERYQIGERNRIFYKKDTVLKAIYETFRGLNMEDKKNFERRETEMSMYQANIGSYKFDEMMEKQAKRLNKAISRPERTKVLNVEFIISRYDIIIKRSNTTVAEYFNKEENRLVINGKSIWLKNKYSKNDLCTNDADYHEFLQVIEYLKSNTFQLTYYGETRFITPKIQDWLIKYIDRIRAEYKLNTADTSKLKELYPVEYEENYEKLSEMEFQTVGKDWEEKIIKLLPHQLEDLSGILLRRNALISWDTWLGKTLGGIVWSQVKGGQTLIIAPAVNTIDPWAQQLKEYVPNASVMLLKKASDIHKYDNQDYLIVGFESLPRIYKALAWFHFRNLILDESDNAKNKASKRFKSLRAIAKRFKNRLLMSGTPTRNNVNEIYNQIELLCQNSRSMMCWATEKIEYDRSSREWDTARNPNYGKPFPAWGGHKSFEETFSPRKLTCFGASETNQDIFNKDIFDSLMRSIRFTRDMEVESPRMNAALWIEDFGIRKEYKQVTVPMSKTEEKVYDFILTDLANQMEAYYKAKHDGATASMLVIMQQIMKLMQGTSHPWTFKGFWDGEDKWHEVYDLTYNTSTKLEKACEIIDETFAKPGINKIMMASPWRETELEMERTFNKKWYTVFRLSSEMSKHARAKLVTAFRTWPGNAIICGTMGVLKSWLNLPEVNTVIAESYPWNFAQLHQYAARAIRLNSTQKTDIYCLTSEGSFDINVFSLILRKEVANKFVRLSEETSVAELSKEFGVESTDIFQQALQMVKEKTGGRTRGTIRWGEKPAMEDSNS